MLNLTRKKRKLAKDIFTRNLFKLVMNSIYGKSLQNQRNKKHYDLITNEEKFLKATTRNTFHSFDIIHPEIVGVRSVPKTVLLDRPIYLGFCILEMSKLHMFKFYYEVIQPEYGTENVKILEIDTDGIIFAFHNIDPFDFMLRNERYFDTSNYPGAHALYSTKNKQKPGLFKNEYPAKCIQEFIGLKSKMYSLQFTDDRNVKKGKGVPHNVINTLNHSDHVESLTNLRVLDKSFCAIRSIKHQLHTVQQNKICLSCFDDKRYILENGIDTLAYGHVDIPS